MGGGYRTNAHDARFDTGGGHCHHPAAGDQTEALGHFGAGHQQRAGTVIDPRGVACGDAATCTKWCAEFLQLFEGGVATRVFVVLDHFGRAFALGNLYRNDFFGQAPAGLGSRGALLTAQGEGVLIGSGDSELLCDVFSGFGHRIDAVGLLHQRVDKAPADGGVVQLSLARKRLLGLAHDHGRA